MSRAPAIAAIAIALVGIATPARALDPKRVSADVAAETAAGEFAFCRDVTTPLPPRGERYCSIAPKIPACKAFVDACAKATATPSPPPEEEPQAPRALAGIARVLLWVLLAVAVAVIALAIVRAIARMRGDAKLADVVPDDPNPSGSSADAAPPPIEGDAAGLLARAAELARRGQHDAALQVYLAAGLRALDARGAIRIARDRTNGEYVRACNDPAARAPLRELVLEVDRVQFGGERASSENVARAGVIATALLRGAAMMTLAVFAMACGGSSRGSPLTIGGSHDPAGTDAFVRLLERQSVSVKPLDRPLSRLDVDKIDDTAIMVDASRVQLDDETSAHLVLWVERGGTLILAGSPGRWPKALHAEAALGSSDRVVATYFTLSGKQTVALDARATVVDHEAIVWDGADGVAAYAEGGNEMYAGYFEHGDGRVLGIASDELLGNASIAIPENATAIVAILNEVAPRAIRFAQPEHGIAPAANPIAAVTRAGLGLGLVHGLVAALILFAAVGVRLTRPKPAPPPARRAFTEHVLATGALYARARMAAFAFAAYARFVEERLRTRLLRGADVPMTLASLAKADVERCRALWDRAALARTGVRPQGDELALLKELTQIYRAAITET